MSTKLYEQEQFDRLRALGLSRAKARRFAEQFAGCYAVWLARMEAEAKGCTEPKEAA